MSYAVMSAPAGHAVPSERFLQSPTVTILLGDVMNRIRLAIAASTLVLAGSLSAQPAKPAKSTVTPPAATPPAAAPTATASKMAAPAAKMADSTKKVVTKKTAAASDSTKKKTRRVHKAKKDSVKKG